MEQAYGISNDPLWKQYLAYLGNIFRGEMGVSTSNFPAPVSEVIGKAVWWTVLLGGTAVIIAFLIGTTLGIIAAWRRGSWADSFLPPFLQLIGSFPYFWLAMLALFFLSFQWGVFPLRHAYSDDLSPCVLVGIRVQRSVASRPAGRHDRAGFNWRMGAEHAELDDFHPLRRLRDDGRGQGLAAAASHVFVRSTQRHATEPDPVRHGIGIRHWWFTDHRDRVRLSRAGIPTHYLRSNASITS
jgi:hypothetical protein